MYYMSGFLISVRLAISARYIALSIFSLLAVALAALLSAQFSGRQPATVALDVGLSAMRLLLPLVLILVVQELLSHEFDRRYFLNSLAYPRSRKSFFLSRFLAVAALMIFLLLLVSDMLALIVVLVGQGYSQLTPVDLGFGYAFVVAFIGLDSLLLTALACLLAVVASTPSFVLIGTLGFMLVARSYGAIVDLLSGDAGLVGNVEGYRAGLGVLAYLLPDLGALDLRMLALYGKMEFLPTGWPWLLLGSLAYTFTLMALAVWALQRKRFA
jgi:Cu-processing system permease protein